MGAIILPFHLQRVLVSRAGVTDLLPGAPYPHAAKGRLSIALGRRAFPYLADYVGVAGSCLVRAIALGSQPYGASLKPKTRPGDIQRV
jgi:hypothetical protein